MEKNKKNILIIVTSIILIAIILIGLYYIIKIKQTDKTANIEKLNQYYEKLKNTESYSFDISLDTDNNIHYEKKEMRHFIFLPIKEEFLNI